MCKESIPKPLGPIIAFPQPFLSQGEGGGLGVKSLAVGPPPNPRNPTVDSSLSSRPCLPVVRGRGGDTMASRTTRHSNQWNVCKNRARELEWPPCCRSIYDTPCCYRVHVFLYLTTRGQLAVPTTDDSTLAMLPQDLPVAGEVVGKNLSEICRLTGCPIVQPHHSVGLAVIVSLFNENLQSKPRYASCSTDCEAVTSSWPGPSQWRVTNDTGEPLESTCKRNDASLDRRRSWSKPSSHPDSRSLLRTRDSQIV